ncbi:Rossmann-like and DUF2520 domain-containing protein [Capnocytophaga sputigena]|jgi:hypothetical protein|uniref:DUF2520 domain-containing protein n=1 Tax=Capnocytophaga sputigena TaxID=1019 RepID=A0AAX2I953_CAPSP|nr:DUF2520 domain-containing protein [Capnocytophaga sputigena]ATA85406.1 DUF2520 domain-containing protein [Capnocytophaga sputigena]EEB64414.1 hypothetical protein CAPSP0001_2640 [Capnocytophaga sputigena ATCC 33612]SQA74624.1 Uncharacterized conserved protein [Capnocytophaga sputigena]
MAIHINIIGAGNMAYQLTQAFHNHPEVQLQQLYNRSELSPEFDAFEIEKTHHLSTLRPADVCIIAVKDEAIAGISKKLPFENQLVVHTSGNTSIEAIDSKNRRGVFYPLQTMNKQTIVDFTKVPFCLEAENTNDFCLLQRLASLLSTKIYTLNSYQRRVLHLAAVFMNNFSNHLVYISQQICKENEVPFEILQPLLAETFIKLQNTSAYDAQTGPARRNDFLTITNHLAMLDNNNYKEIYDIITKSIINTYGRKEL